MESDYWKFEVKNTIYKMFYKKKLNLTEQDNLLFSLECFIDEDKMDFDTYLRTDGKVDGRKVI